MALESVIFQQDPFSLSCKDFHALAGSNGSWSYQYGYQENDNNFFNLLPSNDSNLGQQGLLHHIPTLDYSPPSFDEDKEITTFSFPAETPIARRKRRRTRSIKNKEEVENQRMTHIAVERNRRKQMNDYLAVLRSMMPSSHVQRGDQASIVGGAINFVKELEQLLQILKAQKQSKQETQSDHTNLSSGVFSDFFTFPQYTTCSAAQENDNSNSQTTWGGAEKKSDAIADVEVTMVESHANIKVLMKKNHKQLLKMVLGLQFLRLVVLHLNVTTFDNMVLYCFTVKVEDDSQLTSVHEIAASVYEMIGRIQEDGEDSIS
ncbi:hypothetical protein UlMin_038771 [Ulmus minor]